MEFINVAITGYKKACMRYIGEQVLYNQKNVNATKENTILVTPKEGDEIFAALTEVVSWVVKLYDRMTVDSVTQSEKKFMSGIKYIDNTLKHEKSEFSIYDFIKIGSKHEIKKVGNSLNVSMRIVFTFSDVSQIPVDEKWKNQRDNYMNNIMDKDTNDIIVEAERILKKEYDFGKTN